MIGKPLWRADDITRAVRGQGLHEQAWSVCGVSADSRTVVPGDLFIAIPGSVRDGHDFVAAAFKAGAAAALVSRQPMQVPPEAPLVFVEDTFTSLQDLAREGRARARGKIIAIMGSVGKTSTKEMLRLSLGSVGNVYAGQDDFINPKDFLLALANLPPDADYGIIEMDLSCAGELSVSSLLARPDIAVITTIETGRSESCASPEELADAMAKVFLGMNDRGVCILGRSNPHYARLAAAAKKCGVKKILSFSDKDKADAMLRGRTLSEEGSAVQALIAGQKIVYSVGAPGAHHVENSLAALLTSYAASGKIKECAAALAHYKPSKGRGVSQTVTLSGGGQFKFFDESADASPVSMRATIRVLAEAVPSQGGRRLLVLGDMAALGPTAPDLHLGLAPDIKAAGIDLVFCCGDMMRYLFDALPADMRGAYALDSQEMASLVTYAVRADDVVSVTGAKNMEMERVLDTLMECDPVLESKAVNM